MDNNKGVLETGKGGGRAEVVGRGGGKDRKLYLNNNKRSFKKSKQVKKVLNKYALSE